MAAAGGAGAVVNNRHHGFYWNYGGSKKDVSGVKVIVIQAAFGDATLLEVSDSAVKKYYLVDGGPTAYPSTRAPIKVFENLIEVLLDYAKISPDKEDFKLDGIIITHPDGDHVQGIVKLFQKFPPNQDPAAGKVKFSFPGPLLITKAFDAYKDYMKVFDDANFKIEGAFAPGDAIDAFETQFNFFYPVNKYPGTLYNYKAPVAGGGAPVPRHIYARSRYAIDSSKMNATSILLVIEDPDKNNDDPWVSLNGDSLGHLVIDSLKQKHPKIFKVPHHGSVFNSIPLGNFRPKNTQLTARMVVCEALLTKEIDKTDKGIKKHILEEINNAYDKIVKETPPTTKAWNSMSTEVDFDTLFKDLAEDFTNNLKKEGMNPNELLDAAKKRSNQINENIRAVKKLDDIKNDIYTKNVDKLPKFFTATKYNNAKDETLKDAIRAKVRRKRNGYDLFFKILEKDFTFAEDLAFFLTRTFYNQICANTYFISSGSLHRHPSWEIINGIIAAAHDYKHNVDANYKCRLLLTSGNNIKGKKLQDLYKTRPDGTRDPQSILLDDWTNYVKIQYFTGQEAAVILDPKENNLNKILHGTEKWNSTKTDDELNKLKRKYNSVEGAVALRKKRALASDKYEIRSPSKHYLELVPAPPGGNVDLKMSGMIIKLEVQRIGEPQQEKHPDTGVYEKIEIKQTLPAAATTHLFCKTSHNSYQHLLFVITDPVNNTRKYLKVDALGVLTLEENINDATYFTFTQIKARLATTMDTELLPQSFDGTSYDIPHYQNIDISRRSLGNSVIIVGGNNSEIVKYLKDLDLPLDVSTLTIFDALILLLQSDLNAYFVVDSLMQLVVEKILKLLINEKESKVEYVVLPTGPCVTKANILAEISSSGVSLDLGFNQTLEFKKIEVVYPELEFASNKIYLSGTAKVGTFSVHVKCPMPEPDELPQMEISIPDATSLADIISLLGLTNVNMSNFIVPLLTKLKDVNITEASVTFRQGIHSLQDLHFSKLAMGISFTNLSSYLPSSFSNLKTINTHVVVYHAKTPPIKIALEIEFEFEVSKSNTNTTATIPLSASFATRPVNANSEAPANGYNFTVSIQAGSTTAVGTSPNAGISISNFLKAFGLESAVTAINSIPFINSLLSNVQLKKLVLEMNSKSKAITVFSMELCIFEWELLPNKVTIDQAELNMYYDNGNWQARSKTVASFSGQYHSVDITLELSNNSFPARFTFTNNNEDLTIAKFFEIFGLGSVTKIPTVRTFLQVAVTEAFLEISKTDSGSIRVNRGRISLHYSEDFYDFEYFNLKNVDVMIGLTYDEDQNSYLYGFSISGFINDKLYLSVEYDPNTLILSGLISISTFKQATLFDVMDKFHGTGSVENNVVFGKISEMSSVGIQINMKRHRFYYLTDLEIDLTNLLTLGSFSLDRLRFEYHYIQGDERAGIPSQSLYSVMGVLCIDNKKMGAVLKFDLTKDSITNIVTASIMPTIEDSLTLRKFMNAIGVAIPSIPTVEGQQLPSFFDISLTQGTITFKVENFAIQSFSIHVETTNEITLLESPQIILRKISLKVDYKESATPNTTTVYLLGIFTIGRVELTLQGSKEPNGDTVFRVLAEEETSVDFQKSINKLTPTSTTSPVIPSDIGIPKPLNVLVAELIVKHSPSNNENSVMFTGHTQINWPIDLGFQKFTIKEVGGTISYKKSTITQSPPSSQYKVSVTGQFLFSDDIFMSSELSFGRDNIDTILSVSVADVTEVEIPSVADDLLGFHKGKNNTNSVQFDNLIPQHTTSFLPNKAFININFTKKMFALFCQLRQSLGQGFLIAGDFSTNNTPNYGYTFGISLPEDFKFSELLPPLSAIDEILKVKNANCMIVSIDGVKVSDVVAKMKSIERTAVSNQSFRFPFVDLTLDTFTNDQDLVPGLSVYCGLHFGGFEKGSLFHSIIRITPPERSIPSVILSSLVNQNPEDAIFKAHIASMTLLGTFEFKDVNLIYKPSSKDTFELNGKITISISDADNFEFIGKFTCSSTRSVFAVSTEGENTLVAPLGMVGITLRDIQLSLIYNYPANQSNVTSSQSLSGTVNFYSSSSDTSLSTSTPSVVLTGSIIFNNYTPTVVKLVLETDKPLTIADLVATVFKGSYDTVNFLNVGFVSGQMYYAKLNANVPSMVIDNITYKKGYHIAAEIEIFNKMFTIEADILPDTKTVTVTGYAKAALDLGFAKFTGATTNNTVDETKSPQIVFSTSPNTTSISLVIGLILFGAKIGVGEIGFRHENGENKFFGRLQLEKIDFFVDHIDIEWSKKHGFKVKNWPISSNDFQLPFDFFEKLKTFNDECGALTDLIFREGVKTKFDTNVGLSKADDSSTFLAHINITGTYNVLLGDVVKIASVELPDISVGIPKTENLTLSDLPGYVLRLFRDNADRIVKQILDHPDRLAKIVGLTVLKKLTKEMLSTLVCRNADTELENELDPDSENAEDPTENDFNEAENAEQEFGEDIEAFDGVLEGGGDAVGVAGSAATAEGTGDVAAGAFSAVISAIGTFLSIITFGLFRGFKRKKEEAERRRKAINDRKQKEIIDKMTALLDIRQHPRTEFVAPNTLKIFWHKLRDHSINYHVVVQGWPYHHIVPVEIYNEVVNPVVTFPDDPKITLHDERFYDMVALHVKLRGTITGVSTKDPTKHYTYYGPEYNTVVPKVHPTLHPPSNLQATYDHLSRQIRVTAYPVHLAQKYVFQLIDSHPNLTVLGHPCIYLTPNTHQIQCHFPQSSIQENSIAPFKVRGHSAMIDDREHPNNVGIVSSVFVISNDLPIVPPPINLKFTLPHFDTVENIKLEWDLPNTTIGIIGFTCQIIDDNSKDILLTKDFMSTALPMLPKLGTLDMNDLITAVNSRNYTFSDIVKLAIRVSSISDSQHIIDSAFVSQSFVSLKSPEHVTANFSSEKNALQISWLYSQQTSGYGVEIRDIVTSDILWSRMEVIRQDHDVEEGKVGKNYSLTDIAIVNNPSTEYSVQVIAVATGNETFDSFIPNKAPGFLRVLHVPHLGTFEYLPHYQLLSASFDYDTPLHIDGHHSLFAVNLRKSNEQEVIFNYHVDNQYVVNLTLDQYIDKFDSGDVVRCSVYALGSGLKISSPEVTFPNMLTLLPQPTNVTCTYNADVDGFVVNATGVPGVQKYLLGFYVPSDPNGYRNYYTRLITVSGNSINFTLEGHILRPKIQIWRFYIQSLLTDNSTTQLPSPRLYLNQDITLFNQPQLKSLQYANNVLTLVIAEPIEHATNYRADINIIATDSSVIKTFSKIIPVSNEFETNLKVNIAENVVNWQSILDGDHFQEIRASVLAVGSRYTMSSANSNMKTVTRLNAPDSFTCQYSSSEDLLKVKFRNSGIPTGATMKVIVSSVGGEIKKITKELKSPPNDQLNVVTFTGKEIREQEENMWMIYGWIEGDLPSKRVAYSTHYQVLDTPHILSAAYRASTTIMGVNWTVVTNVDSYRLVVGYETLDEEKHSVVLTSHNRGTGMTFIMKAIVSNWGEVSDTSKLSLILTAMAPENGTYLNSKHSAEYDIDQQFTFFTSSNETTLSLKWGSKYENRNIKIASDDNFFTTVQDAKHTDIPKRLFLYPNVNLDPERKGITVTVDDETTNDEYSSIKSTTVQVQKILETDILGYNSEGTGQYDDGLSAHGSSIVGIKHLVINHNEESVTRIRVSYRLANKSIYFAPFRGTHSSSQVTIDLEDKESIIAVSASTSRTRGLSRLEIITQKPDGTYSKHGPFGDAFLFNEVPIRFSGNVISFKGRTDSGGLKNLGFHYTLITPTLQRSPEFGGAGGNEFEDNVFPLANPVSHVHSINLQYDGLSIVSIKPYYQQVNGKKLEFVQRGGFGYDYKLTLHPVEITFEEGEILIGISGKLHHNDRVPDNILSSLKLTSQKSNGTLKEYGPYGKPHEEGGTSFIMRGRIHGFFGKAGWIIDNIGVYYSLENSEIFGGPGGVEFEDVHTTKLIAHLKKLHIRYNSFYIRGIYGTYILSDGSAWVGPKHGTSSDYDPGSGIPPTSLKTIEFAEDEDIISMIVGVQKVTHSEKLTVGYLEIVTQMKDGRRKEYPRICKTFQDNPHLRSEREFKGRVVSLKGRSSTNNINALGIRYIPLPDELNTPIIIPNIESSEFGELREGVGFNHKERMPSDSPIARVKSLTIQYDSLSLVSISPEYEFENGQTYEPPTQGGPGYSQTVTQKQLNFANGEILVGIKGWYTYDSRSTNTAVSQLSAITQKSDGTIATYGPYGKGNGGTSFMTWGVISCFFGRSAKIINQIGVYSFLHRTDLIGTNEGIRFSDDHGYFMTVGIRKLKIRYSHKIHSIQATYESSQGHIWEAPARGTDTNGVLQTFAFAEDEDIVSIKVTMSGYVVGGLEITTQRRDGSHRITYPRVGIESEGRDVEIKGRVVTLIGRSQYNLNAIGAKYIPLPNEDN